MKSIVLNSVDVPYNVTRKNNKNTYFHFKRDGYVQINLSRHQNVKDALAYMEQNAARFVAKFQSNAFRFERSNEYVLWGKKYDRTSSKNKNVTIDSSLGAVFEPEEAVDREKRYYTFEKQEMLSYLHVLHAKYANNPHVPLEGILYKTRYTNSRHGSCNPKRRTININLNLIRLEKIYTEYVYCHEIAHLKHPNHSKDYYELLGRLFPRYKEVRRELKQIW